MFSAYLCTYILLWVWLCISLVTKHTVQVKEHDPVYLIGNNDVDMVKSIEVEAILMKMHLLLTFPSNVLVEIIFTGNNI